MAKSVVVIASGETERRALPHLVAHLRPLGAILTDIRIPPRGLPLNVGMAERLIKAAWFSNLPEPPNKFVVVADTDRTEPKSTMRHFKDELPQRLQNVAADVLYAYAQQHLEAWFFASSERLRDFIGRDLGAVDASKPDEIQNPKLHLKHLLGHRIYTARVSEAIARSLEATTIAERSPSFRNFLSAYVNGGERVEADV